MGREFDLGVWTCSIRIGPSYGFAGIPEGERYLDCMHKNGEDFFIVTEHGHMEVFEDGYEEFMKNFE